MILTYSRKSVLCFQSIINFCAIFGIIPLYNFYEKRFPRRKLFTSYLFLIVLVIIGAEVDTVWKIYNIERFTLVTLVAVVGEILGILIWCTALYQACFKRHVWESLFTELDSLEALNSLNTAGMREKNILKNVNFQLVCTVTMVLGLFAYEQVTFFGKKERVFLFNSSYIFFFLHFLMSFIIGNMGVVLKNKFEDINVLLASLESEPSVSIIKGTKKVKDFYSAMTEIVEKFNDLFGPQLFLMGLHCSSQILQWSVALVYSMFSLNEKEQQYNDYIRLVVGVIYIFLMLIWLGVTMFCCDMAVVESEEIIIICYRIQLKYSVFSEPYQSIKNLLYLVNNSKIKFTAMDYYEINRSTMFDLIGTTATYFVVLIQFYDGKKQKGETGLAVTSLSTLSALSTVPTVHT